MRQGGPNNGRRSRGRHHGGGGHGGGGGGGHQGSGGGNGNVGTIPGRDNRPRSAASLRHQTFDSNCIDMRVRGNAWQVYEKYQALARDAQSAGDRVAAENYLQHAEHYFRIIEAINEATAAEQRARGITPTAPGAPGQPPQFGDQPAMPANYYGAPGAQPGSQQPGGQPQTEGQQPSEATATPAASSPFFSADEAAEDQASGPAPLVARR